MDRKAVRIVRPGVWLVLAALLGACAASRGAAFPLPLAAGERSVALLAESGDLRPLFLTVYPRPRRAEYGDALLDLDHARRVDPTSADFEATLARHDLVEAWERLADQEEGFLLLAANEADGALVLTGARDVAGSRWMQEAIRQLTLELPEGRLIRECRVEDGPGFSLRGSARPQQWERDYRANLDWGARAGQDGGRAVARLVPDSPLDATPAAVGRIARELHALQERGARRFVIDFENAAFAMTPQSAVLYDSYPDALVALISAVRARLMVEDPDAVVYVLPHTHWWNDDRMAVFAAALRHSGGLGPGTGIVLTGPDVASRSIDADGFAAALDLFGLPTGPALVYDRAGGAADWGPLSDREPALCVVAEGVVGGRGSPVSRLTQLDWMWNPSGYSPERSWQRALFELAGPQGFQALREACQAFRARASRADAAVAIERFADADDGGWRGPLAKQELVDRLRHDLVRLPGPGDAGRPSVKR